MRIIGYHIQDNQAVNSEGEASGPDIMSFLLADKPDSIKVFYNLDWAVARIIYFLEVPRPLIQKLWNTGRLYWRGYSIFFVPHRYINIQYGQHWGETNFSDIFQYDNDLPFEVEPLDAAKCAAEIGQEVYEAMKMIGLEPTTLSSPVSAFQKQILATLDLPTWEDTPAEVLVYANRCLHGGWQECYKKGHFKQVWDYDLTSAYSYFTSQLIDFRYGRWEKARQFYSKLPFGFYRGTIKSTADFHPFIYETKKEQLTPIGTWNEDYRQVSEIKHLYDFDRGQFKIDDGWVWHPDKIVMPLKQDMETLAEWKQKLPKGLKREIVKRIMNGTWGKTGEVFHGGGFGKMYNPVWAASIEPGPRLEVSKFIISNKAENNVISIAVDGTMLSKEVHIPDSEDMGDWRFNMSAPAYAISSGISCIKGKQGHGAFCLNYDWLSSQIASHPDADHYSMSKQTPVTIGYALAKNKLDKLGELETTERSVIIGYETKRLFRGTPHTGRDLATRRYDSVALDIGIAKANQYSD